MIEGREATSPYTPFNVREPRCAKCGRTTDESEHKSLGLTAAGWLCDGNCRAAYEGDKWWPGADHEF